MSNALPSNGCFVSATPQPAECESAIDLIEDWRQDHDASNIQPNGYNCDLRDMNNNYPERPWFRFSGAAGNMMLDTCVLGYSCGTHAAMWTDDPMPSEVGVSTEISAYASWTGNCRWQTKSVLVMRCSHDTDYDFIYQYNEASTSCSYSFCGMTKA